MTIGERIRMLRGDTESQDALAKSIGVSREMVSQYESDDVKDWPLSRLERIAKHYQASPCWLAFGIGEPRGAELGYKPDVLCQIIEAVYSHLRRKSLTLPPNKFAQLVIHLYDQYNTNDRDTTTVGMDIERLVGLIF